MVLKQHLQVHGADPTGVRQAVKGLTFGTIPFCSPCVGQAQGRVYEKLYTEAN